MGTTPAEEPAELPSPSQLCKHARKVLSETWARQNQARAEKIRANLRKALSSDPTGDIPPSSPTPPTARPCPAARAVDAICARAREPVAMPAAVTPPGGLAWVRVHQNIRVPTDCGRDFFVPYLGESEAHLKSSNNLAVALLTGSDDEDNADSEIEAAVDDDQAVVRASPARARREGRSQSASTAAREDAAGAGAEACDSDKYSFPAWDRAAKRVALITILDHYQCNISKQIAVPVAKAFRLKSPSLVFEYHASIVSRAKRWKLQEDQERIKNQHQKELKVFAKGDMKPSPAEILKSDSIGVMLCRQCYTYDCALHDLGQQRSGLLIPDGTRKDVKPKEAVEALEASCEDLAAGKCWSVASNASDNAEWAARLRKSEDVFDDIQGLLRELFYVYGEDYCRISAVLRTVLPHLDPSLRLHCSRIGYLSQDMFRDRIDPSAPPALSQPAKPLPPRSKKNWSDSKAKSSRAPPGCSKAETEAMKKGIRLDYTPCVHEGPCTTLNCSCIRTGVRCEKYCECNHVRAHNGRTEMTMSCRNAFRGCTCKSAIACVSNSCICYSAGRECDPDLCRSCLDCKDELPSEQNARNCRNVGLLMGDRHRTVVGRSTVHGWGVFAVSAIPKGDIIGEYVGEIIAQSEAECRGRVYDEVNYSFLFNITVGLAVDSTRLGNKLRFCNHSQTPNCQAKVKRVGGDIRVGLYAKRHIQKNEELFFDYGYRQGPEWAMAGKKKLETDGEQGKKRKRAARKTRVSSDSDAVEVLPTSKRRRLSEPDPKAEMKTEPKAESKPPATRQVALRKKKASGDVRTGEREKPLDVDCGDHSNGHQTTNGRGSKHPSCASELERWRGRNDASVANSPLPVRRDNNDKSIGDRLVEETARVERNGLSLVEARRLGIRQKRMTEAMRSVPIVVTAEKPKKAANRSRSHDVAERRVVREGVEGSSDLDLGRHEQASKKLKRNIGVMRRVRVAQNELDSDSDSDSDIGSEVRVSAKRVISRRDSRMRSPSESSDDSVGRYANHRMRRSHPQLASSSTSPVTGNRDRSLLNALRLSRAKTDGVSSTWKVMPTPKMSSRNRPMRDANDRRLASGVRGSQAQSLLAAQGKPSRSSGDLVSRRSAHASRRSTKIDRSPTNNPTPQPGSSSSSSSDDIPGTSDRTNRKVRPAARLAIDRNPRPVIDRVPRTAINQNPRPAVSRETRPMTSRESLLANTSRNVRPVSRRSDSVPIVSLVSDDDDGSSSSYEPNFFNWFG